MWNWYASSSADLRNAKKLLVELREEVAKNGWINKEEWRDKLTDTFGTECFNLLTVWDPVSVDEILITRQNVAHSKVHGSKLHLPPSTEGVGKENVSQESVTKEGVTKKGARQDAVKEGESKNLVVDPNANWQMSVKLIDLLRIHVEGLMRIKGLAAEGPDETTKRKHRGSRGALRHHGHSRFRTGGLLVPIFEGAESLTQARVKVVTGAVRPASCR